MKKINVTQNDNQKLIHSAAQANKILHTSTATVLGNTN